MHPISWNLPQSIPKHIAVTSGCRICNCLLDLYYSLFARDLAYEFCRGCAVLSQPSICRKAQCRCCQSIAHRKFMALISQGKKCIAKTHFVTAKTILNLLATLWFECLSYGFIGGNVSVIRFGWKTIKVRVHSSCILSCHLCHLPKSYPSKEHKYCTSSPASRIYCISAAIFGQHTWWSLHTIHLSISVQNLLGMPHGILYPLNPRTEYNRIC